MTKERTLNASQAQELYGVNRSTVGRWIKAGKLFARDGVFFEADFLAIVNASKSGKIKRGAKPKEKKPAPAPSTKKQTRKPKAAKPAKPAVNQIERTNLDDLIKDEKLRKSVETELSIEKLESQRLKNAVTRADLISRDLVRVVLGQLFTIHTNELKPVGQKTAPEIMAIVGIEDADLEAKVAGNIDKETHRVLNHIKRTLSDFLKATRTEHQTEEEDELI